MKLVLVVSLCCFIPVAFSQVLPDSGVDLKKNAHEDMGNQEDSPLIPKEAKQALVSKYRRKIIDILALPNKDETYLGLNYEYGSSSTKRGTGSSEIKTKSHKINLGIERGVSESLSVQVQIGYLLADATYLDSQNLGNSKGVTDPSIGLNYRLLDISTDRFDMNINPYFSPSIQNATSSSGNKDGNGSRGFSYMGVKTGFGRRDGPSSWALTLDYSKSFKGKFQDVESGEKTKISSFQGLGLQYDNMKYLTPLFALKGQLGLGFVEGVQFDYDDKTSGHSNSKTVLSGAVTAYYEYRPNVILSSEIGISGATDAASTDSYDSAGQAISTNTGRVTFSLGVLAPF